MNKPTRTLTISVILLILIIASFAVGRISKAADTAEPQGFRLTDESNRLRAEMKMDRGVPMFVLYDEQGNNCVLATQYLLRIRKPNSRFLEFHVDDDRFLLMLGSENGEPDREIDLNKLADLLEE
jgi:hypothetical protein